MNPSAPTGPRFAFGANWESFASSIHHSQIEEAERALRTTFDGDLRGRRFLDVGSGSGLSSLAAYRLGAEVHAFDYDPVAVNTTIALRNRFTGPDAYMVEQGDILNTEFTTLLGKWDVVYSWGVLHHTGAMWDACAHAANLVAEGGVLCLALYNDQGWQSRVWRTIKRAYVTSGPIVRRLLIIAGLVRLWGPTALKDLLRHRDPRHTWRSYASSRGMSPRHDLVDWIGGYPFEVARPQDVRDFFARRRFIEERSRLVGAGLGCNEYVYRRQRR